MSLHPEHRYSSSEYIEMDRASGVKSEYLDGVIYNMGGPTGQACADCR